MPGTFSRIHAGTFTAPTKSAQTPASASTPPVLAAHACRTRRRAQELGRAAQTAGRSSSSQAAPLEAIRLADADAARATREDYSLTGAILAGLGALAMFAGRAIAYGPWAVGLYSAGTIAIVTGFGLAIFGAVLRLLARPLIDPADPGPAR